MTTAKAFPITYAHCVKYTPGQLDREPHSAYETRSVTVSLWRIPGERQGVASDDDYFHVKDEHGNIIGHEDTKEGAIFTAQYNLMNDSRKQASLQGVAQS